MFGIIFLVILVVIAVVLIGMYNSLVQLRVRTDSAWSDIDVQLKRWVLPDKYYCRHVQLHRPPVLRNHRRRRPRTSSGKVLIV
jgi:hypothetical protein